MNHPRLVHALRITWTAFSGIAAVLLVVLWVRSYSVSFSQTANLNSAQTWGGAIGSYLGEVSVCIVHMPNGGQQTTWYYGVPYWYLLLLCPTAAAFPWLHWRFSLRTLLIFMTIAAVVLGLGVWVLDRGTDMGLN